MLINDTQADLRICWKREETSTESKEEFTLFKGKCKTIELLGNGIVDLKLFGSNGFLCYDDESILFGKLFVGINNSKCSLKDTVTKEFNGVIC